MFRRFICLLCAILLCGTASAAVCLRMEDGAALVEADGRTIVEAGVYADIVSVGEGFYAAGEAGAYALLSETGEKLSEGVYDSIECGAAIIAERDGRMGLLDEKGGEKSAFVFEAITPDADGRCWALSDEADSALGLRLYILEADGTQTQSELRLARIGETADQGLLSAKTTAGKYGYVDRFGKMAIEAQYQYAADFIDGRAVVAMEDKFGVIDTMGNWLIAPEYDYLEISEYGYILGAQTSERIAIFDGNGTSVDEYFGENISVSTAGRYYIVRDEISLRVYDDAHCMLLEAPPSASVSAGVGEQLLLSYGVFGEESSRIWGTENKYQHIFPLGESDGEGIYGFMTVNAVKYENHMLGEAQYSLDMSTARYGVLDEQGEILLESQYLSIENVGEGRLLVQTEDQYQMIEPWGKVYWSAAITRQSSVQ